MKRNATIEQVLEGMGQDNIRKIVESPSKGITMIVIGIILFFTNDFLTHRVEIVAEPVLLITGIAMILWGILVITSRKPDYLDAKSGQLIQFTESHYDANQYDKLIKIIESGRYDELSNLHKISRDGVKLKVATSSDKQMCYVQVLRYVPYAFAFTTVVKKLDFEQAAYLLSMIQ